MTCPLGTIRGQAGLRAVWGCRCPSQPLFTDTGAWAFPIAGPLAQLSRSRLVPSQVCLITRLEVGSNFAHSTNCGGN
jgi:hypothetical protein